MKEGRTSFSGVRGWKRFASLAAGVVVASVLLPATWARAGDIYVDGSATGSNDGSSWANAYTDLQTALTAAVSGDTINIAKGTYRPTTGTDRTATFQLKNGVALLGGYPNGGGTRNPAANISTLSGDIGVAIDNSDNSYTVVTGSNTDATTILEGVTVANGNSNGSLLFPTRNGGGMYTYSGSPTLTNVTFSGNSAIVSGGGMYNWESSPTLTNVTFSGNSAYFGGGIDNFTSSPTLTNVTFSGNTATTNGGGMGISWSSSPTLTNVTFNGNSAGSYGGGMVIDRYCRPTLTNVTFSGNLANTLGGGVAIFDNSSPTIRNTILWWNTAPMGTQINYDTTSTPTVTNCVVQDGYAGGSGIISTDPLLGMLGTYGGYTRTIPLLPGSSAIDTAEATYAPNTDQRGVPRPQGAGYDIGAYEYDDIAHEPPPTVQFTSSSQTSSVESGTMTVTAELSKATEQNVIVPFSVNGTATNGTDYTITESPITIPAGSTSGSATITATQDTTDEPDETVVVTMGSPTNATKGTATVHTATITDDDSPPVVHDVALTSLSASPNPASKGQMVTFSYTVKNNGSETEDNLTFKLSYGSTALGKPQTVGSLTAGQQTTKTMTVKVPRRQRSGDYLITGTVSIVSGETDTSNNSKTVKVTVK